uniref:hypothetical protein n=1 Tax=Streptomyces sp. CA-141956 TaxID=3240051 RepID=UPI003F4943E9
MGLDAGIVRRDPAAKEFAVQPHSLAEVAERTLDWLMNHHRLAATTKPSRPDPKP